MAKVLKNIRLEDKMIEEVQAIADEHFDGNFTAALLDCATSGINMRKVPEQVRCAMKSGMLRYDFASEYYDEHYRVVIDALQI